jgi:AAA15 family ATPase/GTPase
MTIHKLQIKNFKSIKELDLDCTRVNVFIGEPNAGKSNMLEVLGLLCSVSHSTPADIVRYESPSNIFYDDLVEEPVVVSGLADNPKSNKSRFQLTLSFSHNQFYGKLDYDPWSGEVLTGDYTKLWSRKQPNAFGFVKFYRYKPLETFPAMEADSLNPPHGDNLFSLMKSRKEVRNLTVQLLGRYGLKPSLRMKELKIEASKQQDELLFTYPYVTISDTLKHMLFHLTAMVTNTDATIVFEEPESNSFPFYSKDLAERIGLDKRNNQYFITTHNPYFLESVIEKTPEDDLSVNLTYYSDYRTHIKRLEKADISELLDADPFFSLDRFIGDE